MRYLLLFTLFTAFSSHAELFSPQIKHGSDQAVCRIVQQHYQRQFESDVQAPHTQIQSDRVNQPRFEPITAADVRGILTSATLDFGTTRKLAVYHRRNHSWRGDIHTGYLIDPEQLPALKAQLKTGNQNDQLIKPFYPMGSLQYGSDFSWWENLPFQFNGSWYVMTDFGDFHRHDAMREVYRIFPDSSSEKVCSLQIFQNYHTSSAPDDLKYFSYYNRAVRSKMLSTGHCGTSTPEVSARWNGEYFTSQAIYRPWALKLPPQHAFQQQHFHDWQYSDIWSQRQHAVIMNAAADARAELEAYYQKHFNYTADDASRMAEAVIKALPYSYYSLGIYYDEGKDFTFMDQISLGSYDNWANIKKDLKLKYGTLPLTALSLAADTPAQLNKLPETHPLTGIVSRYKKDLLMYAAHMNNLDAVKTLTADGWPVDSVTAMKPIFCEKIPERLNRSALTYAVENASLELIRHLIEAGSDTSIKDSKGNNLDYYLQKNPRFTKAEKDAGLQKLLADNTPAAITPSFNCSGSLNRIERAICSSEGLSIYDRELSTAYRNAREKTDDPTFIKRSQHAWLKSRNQRCGQHTVDHALRACLAKTTRARTRYLRYMH